MIKLLLVVWLWFVHDRPIRAIHEELLNVPKKVNEDSRGRGITRSVAELQIKSLEKPLEIELKRKELKRKQFLDRTHLIFKVKS